MSMAVFFLLVFFFLYASTFLAAKNILFLDDSNFEQSINKEWAAREPMVLKEALSPYSLPLHDNDRYLAYTSTIRSLQELTRSPPLGSIVCPSPHLTPIYDKIVGVSSNDTSNTAHRKIPRILHVSFNNRCVPNDLADSITRWQRALPDHSIFFHDDEAVQRLMGVENQKDSQLWHLSKDFPELRNNMRCVKFKGAMLIDIWRVLILWTYGGLYTDIDNWPGPKFNARTTIRDEDSFFSLSDARGRPSQWLFGMTPRHPIAIFTLQEISRRLLRIKNIARPRVVSITGPKTLSRAYEKFHNLLRANASIFGDSSYYTQVQKIGLAESGEYAKGNLGDTFDEIVDYFFDEIHNTSYTNITKRSKSQLLSGVVHWTEAVKLDQPKGNTTIDSPIKAEIDQFDGISCADYLASLR